MPGDVQTDADGLPAHRYALADGWSVWRQPCLRSAGFPVEPLSDLRAPCSSAAVEIVAHRHAALESARCRALACCRERTADTTGEDKRLWRRRRRALKHRRPMIAKESGDPEFDARCRDVYTALAQLDAATARFDITFAEEARQRDAMITDLVGEPRFREALAWQNRALLNRIGALASRERKRSARNVLVLGLMHYWYRYRTKNESIGFFGPVAWAHLADTGDDVSLATGSGLVAHRDVQFEYWALDRICRAFARQTGVREWLVPRWSRRCRIDGDDFVNATGKRIPLRGVAGEVLRCCAGVDTAHAIATRLQRAGIVADIAQTYRILEQLAAVGTLDWTFTVPVTHAPEPYVTAQIRALGDANLRRRLLGEWQQITACLDRVRALTDGDGGREPEQLNRALGDLDAKFTRLTGAAPTRNPGRTYGGRALAYEDCRRDVDVTLATSLFDAIAQPLSLLGASARWYTFAVANTFEQTVTARVREHLQEQHVTHMPLAPYVNSMTRIARQVAARHTRELQAKWTAILACPVVARRVHRTSAALGDRIRHAFAAPHPGWPGARFHTPDLMLYRKRDGSWQWVLGEFHAAMNTALHRSMLSVHPDPATLRACYTRDKAGAEFSFVPSREFTGGHRIAGGVVDADDDIAIALEATPSDRPPAQCVDVASLQLVDADGRIRIRDIRDGSSRPLATIFQAVFRLYVMNGFRPIAAQAHTPRIYLDDLIVRRESWRVAAAEIPFLDASSAARRFQAARSWQHAMGLPREVFIRAPLETKPVYLDFTAPLTLDIARRILKHEREAGNVVTLSEMLPATAQAWLTDAQARRYTSELRMPLVDPIACPAA